MQKASLELEKAREEFMRADGHMRSHDMANLSEEQAKHLLMEDKMREFKLKHEREFDEQQRFMELQRRDMEDHIRRDWIRQQEMKREMEQFYRMKKDSNVHMKHRNPYMEAYPEAPAPPPLPPADIDAPDMPDIESPVPPEPPDIENLVHPKPVDPLELLNNDKGTEKKENAEQLESKLKEVEEE